MAMSPRLRKFALAVHLTGSVGWIGAVFAYLGLSLAARRSEDAGTVRAAWIGMELVGWYVIVPLAIVSLVTGLVMALGTKWGLFQHYWVLFSFVLTTVSVVVLLLHMPDVSALAEAARTVPGVELDKDGRHLLSRLSRGDLLHPSLGLIVLLAIQVMNLYKPRGLTRYGWRKQQDRRTEQAS